MSKYVELKNTQPQVKIIGFMSLGTEKTDTPIDKDFMCDSDVPKELIDTMIENGWVSKDGMNDWEVDFQPPIMKDDCGQKWMMLNNRTLEDRDFMRTLMEGEDIHSHSENNGETNE